MHGSRWILSEKRDILNGAGNKADILRKVRNPYMNITQNIGIRICGTGSSVPAKTVTNDDMATIVETNDE